jgi:hypothetical protein
MKRAVRASKGFGNPSNASKARDEGLAMHRNMIENLAAELDAIFRLAYKKLVAMSAQGIKPEISQDLPSLGPVLLELEIHPDKGPEICVNRSDRSGAIGYWYAPGHQYNPLPADKVCWPTFLENSRW